MHKRAMGAVAVTGIAALLMSACGGSSTPAAKPSAKTAAAPATSGPPVRDAGADLVIWADNDRVPVVQKYADAFGKENGIKVVVQVATDVRQQFKDATKVGKGPDVIVGAHDWLGELVQNNTVAPVNLAADVAAKFAPQAIAATTFNGQSYGVPYAIENIALVRNAALAPAAPATMNALVRAGQALVTSGKATNIVPQEVGKVGTAFLHLPLPQGSLRAASSPARPMATATQQGHREQPRLGQWRHRPCRAGSAKGLVDQSRRALRRGQGVVLHHGTVVDRQGEVGGNHVCAQPAAESDRRRQDAGVPGHSGGRSRPRPRTEPSPRSWWAD
jgi:hypothetical protein